MLYIFASPWDSKEIQPVNPKGNQSWIFIGRTDAQAETPIFCPPDVKSQLIRKEPDAGKDWKQEEKGTTEVEMVGWHHWFKGHKFEQTQGVSEGQGSLACCSPWVTKSWTRLSDWTRTTGSTNYAGKRVGLRDIEGRLGTWWETPNNTLQLILLIFPPLLTIH